MTDAGFVIAGWALGIGVVGSYAWALVRRGRRVSARVPAEQRRWG